MADDRWHDGWQEGWQAGYVDGMAAAKRALCSGCKDGLPFHPTTRGWHDAQVDGGRVTKPCSAWMLYDQANPKPACRACGGSGVASKGGSCYPCSGTGLLNS